MLPISRLLIPNQFIIRNLAFNQLLRTSPCMTITKTYGPPMESQVTSAIMRSHHLSQRFASTSPPPNANQSNQRKKPDDIEYEVKFMKPTELREVIKKFYSVYGPLFICCHISVSLISLGFWYSFVYLLVDPIEYLPYSIVAKLDSTVTKVTGEGSKFIAAYAIHKILLPLRLLASIYLTRRYATLVQPYSVMLTDKISSFLKSLKSSKK